MSNILLIVSNRTYVNELTGILNLQKHRVVVAEHGIPLGNYVQDSPDVIIMDAAYGQAMIDELRKVLPGKPVLCLLPDYNARFAVEMLRKGAYECLCPPLRKSDVIAVVNHAVRSYGFTRRDAKTSWRSYLYAARTGILVVATILLFFLFRGLSAPDTMVIELPYANPTAVVSDGRELWISNWYTQSVYRYQEEKRGVNLTGTYYFSDFGPLTLTLHGGTLWSAGNDLVLRQHGMNESLDPLKDFKLNEHSPSGMAFVNGNLWVCDAYARKLFAYALADNELRLTGMYDCEFATPAGLFWDGERLWMGDAKNNKVYRFSLKMDKVSLEKTFRLPAVGSGFLSGLSVAGGKIYVVYADNPSRLYRYSLKSLKQET
ncbi:MAG: NHL repeat-containing protein [Endomicrobiales bacterium]